MIKKLILSLALLLCASPTLAGDTNLGGWGRVQSDDFRLQNREDLFRSQKLIFVQQSFLTENLDLLRLYRYPIPQGFFLQERGFYGRY